MNEIINNTMFLTLKYNSPFVYPLLPPPGGQRCDLTSALIFVTDHECLSRKQKHLHGQPLSASIGLSGRMCVMQMSVWDSKNPEMLIYPQVADLVSVLVSLRYCTVTCSHSPKT